MHAAVASIQQQSFPLVPSQHCPASLRQYHFDPVIRTVAAQAERSYDSFQVRLRNRVNNTGEAHDMA
jgi:hypothetical protein